MKRIIIRLLGLLSVVFVLASCGGAGSLGFTNSATPASTTGPGSGSGEDPTQQNAIPTTTIILPSLTDDSRMLVYNNTDSNYVPVVDSGSFTKSDGTAITSTDGYSLAVSDESLSSIEASINVSAENRSRFSFIKEARADDLGGICSQSNVTCCDYPTTECYYEFTDQSVSQLHIGLVNPDGTLASLVDEAGVAIENNELVEPINHNLLWLAQNPQDIQLAADGYFGVLGQDMLAQIKYNSELTAGRFQVQGDHLTQYKSADAVGAASIAFDESSNLTLRQPEAGIDIFSSLVTTDLLSFTDSERDVTVADTEEYTQLKYTGEKLLFVRKPLPDKIRSDEYIYNATSGARDIMFIDGDLTYDDSTAINVANTITFDEDAAGYALVVFEDDRGGVRVRMATNDTSVLEADRRFGGEDSVEASDYNFLDVQIFHENTSGSDLGQALLLDSLNSKLWIVSFNHFAVYADDVKSITLGDAIDLGSSKNPQSFIFNSDKSRVFAVNQGDDTISVVTLVDAEGNVRSVSDMESDIVTINLNDYLNGKTFTVTANKAAYYSTTDGDYLLVGSEGIRGAIVVDLSGVTLPDLQAVAVEEEEETPAPLSTPTPMPHFPGPPVRTH